ncbi:MAG: hypothetical protein E3J71_07265 [Candidatus Stahlbacteria bacterium]|nr:MAG: hypothetical protein E3J71_07265 [Candidatus Stahlbacteria bacterium]
MKKALLCVLSLVLAAGFVVCAKEELVSVDLSPTGDHTINLGDSIQIEVTTDPAVVDSIVLSGIDVTLTEGSEDAYSTWWKAETAGTFEVVATAYLGDQSLESDDTLYLVALSGYFPYTPNSKWTYDLLIVEAYTNYEYPEESYTDTSTGAIIREVVGEEEYEGLKAWKVLWIIYEEYDGDTYVDTLEFYVRVEEDSVYSYDYLDEDPVAVEPALPKLGDIWEAYNFLYDEYTTYEVVADDGEILDYKGCLKIDCDWEDQWLDQQEVVEYWAPNIGMVYNRYRGVDEYGTEKEEYTIRIALTEFSN